MECALLLHQRKCIFDLWPFFKEIVYDFALFSKKAPYENNNMHEGSAQSQWLLKSIFYNKRARILGLHEICRILPHVI